MVMITLVLLHSAAASLMQDLQAGPSPYVLDYITKLNSDCTSAHCVDQLDSCSDGTDADCQKRLTCIRDNGLEDAGECLKSMKWSQLDNTEVKLLDCAHSNKCLPSDAWTASQASSFAEVLAKEKEGRGLAEEEGKEGGTATAAEQAAEQAALEVVAAHLVHLEKTEEMVKQTQGLMDEVLKDKSMSLKEKIEDLHMLTDHLSFLQESAKKAMQGMGLDTSDFDTEEQDEEEEEDHLEEKIHEDEGTEEAEEAEGKPKKAEKKAAKADASKPSAKKPEATAAKKPESKKPEATAAKKPEATAKKPESKKPEAKAANAAKKAEKGATSKPSTKEGKSLAEMHMRTMEDE